MEEDTSKQEVLRVTINGNCSFFVPDTFEHYVGKLREHSDKQTSPYAIIWLQGYVDSRLKEKSEVSCKITDCIQVAQFRLPD